jgi:uncharacterized membrane protein
MRKLPRFLREVGWRTVIGAALLGGVIHISATLALPVLGRGTAFQRVRDLLPVNRMVILPAPAPGKQLLPFMLPDALYAMCRFDLSADPVTVTAALAEPGWALSLHTPQGDNFYVMPAQQLRRSEVSLVIVPGGDRLSDAGPQTRRTASLETHIASPTDEGLIVVRAPLKGLAWRAATEAALRRAHCAPAKRF